MSNTLSKQEISEIRSEFLHHAFKDQFSKKALSLIYRDSLFKLYVPKALNGKECTFREALEYFIHTAYVDGDFGWAVQIGSGGGIFSGYVQEALAETHFKDPHFVIAGSGHPTALAKTTKGGYMVDGSWRYCSGCHYATLITANCKTENDEIRAVALLPEQVEIEEDWNGYGMSNTLSHTVKVNGTFVGSAHTFQVNDIVRDYRYKMFYMPFPVYAKANIFATVVGCFDHLLEETRKLTEDEATLPQKKAVLQDLLFKMEGQHKGQTDTFLKLADQCWEELKIGQAPSEKTQEKMVALIDQSLSFIKRSTYDIFLGAGMTAIRASHPLNKVWRDITTAFQHAVLRQN